MLFNYQTHTNVEKKSGKIKKYLKIVDEYGKVWKYNLCNILALVDP